MATDSVLASQRQEKPEDGVHGPNAVTMRFANSTRRSGPSVKVALKNQFKQARKRGNERWSRDFAINRSSVTRPRLTTIRNQVKEARDEVRRMERRELAQRKNPVRHHSQNPRMTRWLRSLHRRNQLKSPRTWRRPSRRSNEWLRRWTLQQSGPGAPCATFSKAAIPSQTAGARWVSDEKSMRPTTHESPDRSTSNRFYALGSAAGGVASAPVSCCSCASSTPACIDRATSTSSSGSPAHHCPRFRAGGEGNSQIERGPVR